MKSILTCLFSFFICISVSSQVITTFAGNGVIGCDISGSSTSVKVRNPLGMSFDVNGNLYFCNQQCHTICKIDTSGIFSVVAGNGVPGFEGDGLAATLSKLNYPNDIAIDSAGNLYIADALNNRIRKIDILTGIINTVAGTGISGYGGDSGMATSAVFNGINGIVFDRKGSLYVSDCYNNRIRKINNSGIITTIAGNGIAGYSGDGGYADTAMLNQPFDVVADKYGNIYFPDANNKRIRRVDTSGIISTIAGTGIGLYSGDGVLATLANIGAYKIGIDDFGNIYASDSNQRVRKINSEGIISTIAGNGIPGYVGDGGSAMLAQIYNPSGIAVDACGNVFFGDVGNNRIRKITLFPFSLPSISISGISYSSAGTTVTVNAIVSTVGSPFAIKWYKNSELFSTTTTPTTTFVKSVGIDTIIARVVPFSSRCYDSTTSAPHYVSDSSTGVRSVGVMGGVYVYPNPANKQVTVVAGERMRSVAISNMQGQELLRYVPDATSYTVAIDMLPPGMYMVRVNDMWVGKVVKE